MCNSLADGGLRCYGHVTSEIQKLEEQYEKGLVEEAKKSGFPIVHVTPEGQTIYPDNHKRNSPGYYNNDPEIIKAKLMEAHQDALQAKQDMEASPEHDDDKFVSVIDDLSDLKKSLFERFENRGKESVESLEKDKNKKAQEFIERPDIAEFPRAQEYIESQQLEKKYGEKILEAEVSLKRKIIARDKHIENEMCHNNSSLKKLRSKALVSNFFNTENSYSNEKAYHQALADERSEKGIPMSSGNDFPEDKEKINKLKTEHEALKERLGGIRTDYQSNIKRLTKEGKLPNRLTLYGTEWEINDLPSAGSFERLSYKNKLRNFQEIKASYIEVSNKENVPEEKPLKEVVRTSNANEINDLKEFTASYDKKPKVVALKEKISEKKNQLYLTAGYRGKLEKQAAKIRAAGDIGGADRLLERKRKLDVAAEVTIGKNRIQAMSQSAV